MECVGLRVVPRCFGDYLVGLFELWVRDAGARLMGPEAERRWLEFTSAVASPPPSPPCFSLGGESFQREERSYLDTGKLARGKSFLTAAWNSFVWQSALEALDARYGATSRVLLTVHPESDMGSFQ